MLIANKGPIKTSPIKKKEDHSIALLERNLYFIQQRQWNNESAKALYAQVSERQ